LVLKNRKKYFAVLKPANLANFCHSVNGPLQWQSLSQNQGEHANPIYVTLPKKAKAIRAGDITPTNLANVFKPLVLGIWICKYDICNITKVSDGCKLLGL
jgi:hypothetical protein